MLIIIFILIRSDLNFGIERFSPIEIVNLDSEEEDSDQLPVAIEGFEAELETIELDPVSEEDLPVPVVSCEVENR